LIRVAKLESEPGLPKWAKLIDYIDTDFKNGFCFVGEFIGEGTVQIPIGKMRLIFVQSSITYDKHKTGKLRQFRIVKMEKDGTLHWTRIATDDSTGGWALRIRDKTKNFLSQLESIEELKENKNQDEDKPSRFSQVKL
ncbi:MAG TPA: hypothetical protein DIW23_04775, partial [Anaerolineae bacterium]|nr:hypothetical protein [Anaerolineae bacterium]